MSEGISIFMLSGDCADVLWTVFSPSVVADDGSDGGGYTSVFCTTLPSLQVNMIQLAIVVTFFGVAVKKPVEALEVYLVLFTVHTYDNHVTLYTCTECDGALM